jgi:branched-chain amino acid transport system substrate-binding protein
MRINTGRGVAIAAVAVASLAACSSSGASKTATAASTSHATKAKPKSEIKIGVDAGLTGYLAASSDVPFVDGVKRAVSTLNKSGGLSGHKIALTVVDDASTASTGVANANKLISQDGVDVLMGGGLSAQCSAVAPIAAERKVPMTCIAPPPSTGASYAFQVAAGLYPMVATEAAFAATDLHATKIAFVYSQTPYGEAAAGIIQALAPKFGLTVALSQGVDPNSSDLSTLMGQIKSLNVGAVLDNLTGPVHVVEAQGATTAGLSVPLVQTTDSTSVFLQASGAYKNEYFLALPPQAYPSIANPALKKANASLIKAFNGSTNTIGQIAYGWDAMHIIAAAVKKSGAITGVKLQLALQKLQYQGTLSQFAYSAADHTGEKTVPNPEAIAHFVDGKVQVVFRPSN